MSKQKTGWRKLRRYSTPILMFVTLVLYSYVWFTWPKTYYRMQCDAPQYIQLDRQFNDAYQCDSEAARLLLSSDNNCEHISCLRIDE